MTPLRQQKIFLEPLRDTLSLPFVHTKEINFNPKNKNLRDIKLKTFYHIVDRKDFKFCYKNHIKEL